MRICFITPRFPYPPLKGDGVRVFNQLRTLGREHRITLLSLADQPVSEADRARVEACCERVVVAPLSLPRILLNLGLGLAASEPMQVCYHRSAAFARQLSAVLEAGHFDVVHATLIRMLPYVWKTQHPPVVVDLIDSLGLNLGTRADQARGPRRWIYALERRRVLDYERRALRRFPTLLVSSPADRQALGLTGMQVLPNGVDLDAFPFQGAEGRDPATLVFTGNMGYSPNEEALLWLGDRVWPLLRVVRPELRLLVAGAGPGRRVRAMARRSKGIEILGRVPEVSSYLRQSTVAVCPLRSGSGIQNKVLEALASGTPVVATSLANRGIQGVPGRDLLIADTPEDFAIAVLGLLDQPRRRVEIGRAGRAFVEEHFSWELHARRLSSIYAAAVAEREPIAAMELAPVLHAALLRAGAPRSGPGGAPPDTGRPGTEAVP